ncbi:hypothetical protein JCM11641_006063 [Rhodosporidiobolus odoratus]
MEESPPTPAGVKKWWRAFKRQHSHPPTSSDNSSRSKQPTPTTSRSLPAYIPPGRGLETGKDGQGRVFGVSLEQSLQYASVAISTAGPDGVPTIYGYVPIAVAKCGMWLKEAATQTEGIFRVSGSNKRINQLQAVFDEPPIYGKSLDWTGYSVHDAASVLRRYLNSLPDPVIPAGLYLDFTAVLQQPQPVETSIAAYRDLIALLPPASKYLLLYLLDFLSVFARCSAKNLMTASNLAVVFQPGLVSPRGAGSNALLGFPGFVEGRLPFSGSGAGGGGPGAQEQAGEHGRGKEVLEFLIEHQAAFMLDLEPPIDEERQKTKGVTAGPPSPRAPGPYTQPFFPPSAAAGSATAVAAAQHQPVASTSSTPFAAAAAAAMAGTGGGEKLSGADLARRGSEKSVERRRLRKSHDSRDGGKIKRSKTWGSSTGKRKGRGEGLEGSPSPVASATPSPNPPSIKAFSTPPATTSATLAPPNPADRSPQLGHRPSQSKKPRKSADASLPSPSPSPSSAPALAVPATSGSEGAQAAQGHLARGGLLGFVRGKRRSLTPDGMAAAAAAAEAGR